MIDATASSGTHAPEPLPLTHPRGLFVNRTLNLRSIGAVGYDMDYTLVHYRVELWEERAYSYIRAGLRAEGWPVDDLRFDPDLAVQGLVVDTTLGNVVKANRFGYVKRVFHGTRPLPYDAQRDAYRRELVDLRDRRWQFMNTLFSISEAGIYMQLVDKLDAGLLPDRIGYDDLYAAVRRVLNAAHLEGLLKADILADPARFVEPDPDVPLALLDQKHAGKKVLLITNSEWSYAAPILEHAFDPYLPGDMTWRDLFDLAIVGARKPAFFSETAPAFEVVGEEMDPETGALRAELRTVNGVLEEGRAYVGGHASMVEASLGLRGDQILYVGDHVYADVAVSKSLTRWRTALVLRGIEDEIAAQQAFAPQQQRLDALMDRKETLEAHFSSLRLERQRNLAGVGPQTDRAADDLESAFMTVREQLVDLDAEIAPLARAAGRLVNERWGPLLRAGSDKSLLAAQIEKSADVYTARVANFLPYTPYVFLRSRRSALPHDDASPREQAVMNQADGGA